MDLAAIAASAAIAKIVQEATAHGVAKIRRKLQDSNSTQAALEVAFRQAWHGFERSLEASFTLDGATRQNLKELAESDAFAAALSQLADADFDAVDTAEACRLFSIHGPRRSDAGDFYAAWRAAIRRFEEAVASDDCLGRLIDIRSKRRTENLAQEQVRLLRSALAILERGGPELVFSSAEDQTGQRHMYYNVEGNKGTVFCTRVSIENRGDSPITLRDIHLEVDGETLGPWERGDVKAVPKPGGKTYTVAINLGRGFPWSPTSHLRIESRDRRIVIVRGFSSVVHEGQGRVLANIRVVDVVGNVYLSEEMVVTEHTP